MQKIKTQQYKKLELLKSLNNIESNIEDILQNLSSTNLENSIFDLYTPTSKLKPTSRLISKSSQIANYFEPKNTQTQKDFIRVSGLGPSLYDVKSFEIFEEEKLKNYELNFLEINNAFLEFSAIYTMFSMSGVNEQYNIAPEKFLRFLQETRLLYNRNDNIYHNFNHALTVLNGCYYMLKKSSVVNYFTDTGIAAILFASLMHDVDHTGTNNEYHKNAQSDLALTYNDESILENHHCSTAFTLIRREDMNFFCEMTVKEWKIFR